MKRPLSTGHAPHCPNSGRFNLTATSAAPPQELSLGTGWNSPHFLSILLRQLSTHLLSFVRIFGADEKASHADSTRDLSDGVQSGNFEPQSDLRRSLSVLSIRNARRSFPPHQMNRRRLKHRRHGISYAQPQFLARQAGNQRAELHSTVDAHPHHRPLPVERTHHCR